MLATVEAARQRRMPTAVEVATMELTMLFFSAILAQLLGGIGILGLRPAAAALLASALPVGAAAATAAYVLVRAYDGYRYLPFRAARTIDLAIVALAAAPIGEETLFRGLLEGYLLSSGAAVWAAVLVPAVLFSVIHLPEHLVPYAERPPVGYILLHLLYAFVFGVMAGCYRAAADSIVVPIMLHSLANLGGVAAYLKARES